MCVAIFLDPRFKNVGFHKESTSEHTRRLVTEAVAQKCATHMDQQNKRLSQGIHTQTELSIWYSFQKYLCMDSETQCVSH